MTITETERLLIRQFELSDAIPMQGVFCDEDVMQFSSGVKTQDWITKWIKCCFEDYNTNLGGGLWAVVEKSSGDVMGYCGLTYFPDIDGQSEIEIGFRLIKRCWGKGYATEAALAVRDVAFNRYEVSRLVGMIDPRNTASIRVAEKLGMVFEKEVMMPNYSHPDKLFVVNKS